METTSVSTSILEGDNSAHALWLNGHGAKKSPDFEPYRALMKRVLEDAFDCLGRRVSDVASAHDTAAAVSRRKAQLRQEALDWINDDEADGPFSFGSICEELGYDAATVRFHAIAGHIGRRKRTAPVINYGSISMPYKRQSRARGANQTREGMNNGDNQR